MALNLHSSLSHSLVFAWRAKETIDQITGLKPAETGVSRAYGVRHAYRFFGGAEGASDLNFGAHTGTNNLAASAATWAFLATAASVSNCRLACQNDANSVNAGWQVGRTVVLGNTHLGLALERSSADYRISVQGNETIGRPFTFVVVSDGSVPTPTVSIYLNGQPITSVFTSGGSGTTAPATGQNLYLGRTRFDTAGSHDGMIEVALIANRQWSQGEAQAFHRNPHAVFLDQSMRRLVA